jgi:hypothetical protein
MTNPPVSDRDVKLDANHSPDIPPTSLYQYEPDLVTAKEWVQENLIKDVVGRIKKYLISLFPIFSWIYRYNLTWATGGSSSSELSSNKKTSSLV